MSKLIFKSYPRSHFEAIDLSICVIRQWLKSIYLIWFGLTMPLLVTLMILMPNDYLSLILFWFILPVVEVFLLLFLSQCITTPRDSGKRQWTAWIGLFDRKSIFSFFARYGISLLFLSRFSPTRYLELAIQLLERQPLTWQRVKCFGIMEFICLQFSCLVIAIAIFFSLHMTTFFLLPEFLYSRWLIIVYCYLSISLVTPFNVCAGFFLYLNHRIQHEGWDIELAFRQLAKILNHRSALLAIIFLSFNFLLPQTSWAESDQQIAEVMASEDFHQFEKRLVWLDQLESNPTLSSSAISKANVIYLAQLIEYGLWMALVFLIIAIFYRPKKRSRSFSIHAELLNNALFYWGRGQQRRAISILYRHTMIMLGLIHYSIAKKQDSKVALKLTAKNQIYDLKIQGTEVEQWQYFLTLFANLETKPQSTSRYLQHLQDLIGICHHSIYGPSRLTNGEFEYLYRQNRKLCQMLINR